MADKKTTKKSPTKKAPAAKTQARTDEAHFIADDPSTPDVNEAYVQEEELEVVETAPVTVVPETKRARVKGTWRMYFCGQPWDFVDGDSYDLPQDLYEYLRANGNIYDTL